MKKKLVPRLSLVTALLLTLAFAATGWAIVPVPPDPPDLHVCDNVNCETLQESVCSAGGFKITLTNYEAAAPSNSGTATYTYEACSPPLGVCVSNVRPNEPCPDNDFCRSKGQDNDPGAYCTRECAVNSFFDLSHFDVTFPELGNSCLGGNTVVQGTCECTDLPETCDVNPTVVLGDGACFNDAPENSGDKVVAKCEGVLGLNPGHCITMTVKISGDNIGLGLGAAIVVDKAGNTCTASCLAGPSCNPCEETPLGAEACLTRTKRFWGNHPHIAGLFDPVEVCGVLVEGQRAGKCSTSEALCSNAHDYKENPAYLRFVAQLTAAKLNLNATAALTDDVGTCATWKYQDKSIQEWISYCEENYCQESKQEISSSGCIEALRAFNRSQDTGFEVTPPPFDRPGPAKYRKCQAARGNGIFIGNCPGEQPPDCHEKGKKWRRHTPIKD